MCGIAGFIQQKDFHSEFARNIAKVMSEAIIHRGPDDSGVWSDDENIVLAHRRLSIQDLSSAGHQPMLSSSGRYCIAYNGEIYNHLLLRKELESSEKKIGWKGHSDTETILECIENWGMEKTIKKINGMFAFSLWDRKSRKLTLARDRAGEKPLYYALHGDHIFFASELKALCKHPLFKKEVDRNSMTGYLRHNYIPAPYSIYQGVFKLLPGTFLEIDISREKCLSLPEPVPYWSLEDVASQGQSHFFKGSEQEAVNELENLLKDAISLQMISDVPLGAFLSGGVDSSTVVALMQSISTRPVKTFTIGFYEKGYNEAEYAKEVAKHLGTEHTELYVTAEQAMDVILRLPKLYDEPFSDSSQIPTFLVSEMTRQHVTVSLSGDAGDELFGGYTRYFLMKRILKNMKRMPWIMKKNIRCILQNTPSSFWGFLLGMVFPKFSEPTEKIKKLSDLLASDDPRFQYKQLVSHWRNPEEIVLGGKETRTRMEEANTGFDQFEHAMMLYDFLNYLPDDILVKVDRAAMGVSLETRIPFLDPRVIDFAWKLPLSMKIKNNQGKWILRQILYKYVPQHLIERPKMGFGVPIDSWLRKPLRDWAEDLLDEKRLKREGYFNPKPIRQKWEEHLSGKRNWYYHLWDILMFQTWLANS